jgi:hypothetical protein
MIRWLLCGLLPLFAVAAPANGQTTPASNAVTRLDPSTVRLERTSPYWGRLPKRAPLFVGGHANYESLIEAYGLSARARPVSGTSYLLGYLGDEFPEDVDLVAERFEREGEEIRLVLHWTMLPAPKYDVDDECLCVFGAPLPDDLPDGTYRMSVTVRDVPDGAKIKSSHERTFVKPDPILKKRAEEIAVLEKLPLDRWLDRFRAAVANPERYAARYESPPTGLSSDEGLLLADSLSGAIRSRIVARKLEISPYLIAELKREAVRNADATEPLYGIARELMEMLTEIGDARAAPVLVDILAGRLRCNAVVRNNALTNLERLSHVRFRVPESDAGQSGDILIGPGALKDDFTVDRVAFHKQLAERYERWFAEHPADGPDTTPWLHAAQRLAQSNGAAVEKP